MNTTTQKNNGPGYKWEILRNEDDLAEWGEAYLFPPIEPITRRLRSRSSALLAIIFVWASRSGLFAKR